MIPQQRGNIQSELLWSCSKGVRRGFTTALAIFCVVLSGCILRTRSDRDAATDDRPKYEKLPSEEATSYEIVCRKVLESLKVRADVQIKGPTIQRDLITMRVVGIYHFGFIARFVIEFDQMDCPMVRATWFEDYDTNKRSDEVPRLLRPDNQ